MTVCKHGVSCVIFQRCVCPLSVLKEIQINFTLDKSKRKLGLLELSVRCVEISFPCRKR